jgi:hypothetical protein
MQNVQNLQFPNNTICRFKPLLVKKIKPDALNVQESIFRKLKRVQNDISRPGAFLL